MILAQSVSYLNWFALNMNHRFTITEAIMVGAISSTSTASTAAAVLSSSSTSSAELTAQLAAKQSELAQAKTDDDKSKINSEIAKLKAQIAQVGSNQTASASSATTTTATDTSSKASAKAEVSRADKAAPEAKVSGAAMDVLMQMGPQGGMMPPGGKSGAGGPPNISQIYNDIDANDDGKVSKDEFVTDASKHMSTEEATTLFSTMDTESTGAITEDQLAKGMSQGHGGRPPMGPPPAGMTPQAGAASQAIATATTNAIA